MNKQNIISGAFFAALSVSNHAETAPQPQAVPARSRDVRQPPQVILPQQPHTPVIQTQPLNVTRLADFLGVQGGSFSITTSGTQSRTGYRLMVYLEGKPVGQIPWQFESTMWGRQEHQQLTVILMSVEEGIKVSLDINGVGVIGCTIKLDSKTRTDYFWPIKNKDGSISLSAKWKDGTLMDLDPSTGNMVVVLEVKEESEPAGADQPATNPADKVPAKDQPSPPTSKDGPR